MLTKVLFSLAILIGLSLTVSAQSVKRSSVGTGGSTQELSDNGKRYIISQSIGQASLHGTSVKNGYTILQGYQQPPRFGISQKYLEGELEATVFPNPFRKSVHISFKKLVEHDVVVVVHDVAGHLIYKNLFKPSQLISLPLIDVANGELILNVTTGEMYLTTILIRQ